MAQPIITYIIVALLVASAQAAVKPPPPSIHSMEHVLLEQYVLLQDAGRAPSPELVDVVRDISRRHSTGGRTARHYEMHTELFRHILKANSYLYVNGFTKPTDALRYLNESCPVVGAEHRVDL